MTRNIKKIGKFTNLCEYIFENRLYEVRDKNKILQAIELELDDINERLILLGFAIGDLSQAIYEFSESYDEKAFFMSKLYKKILLWYSEKIYLKALDDFEYIDKCRKKLEYYENRLKILKAWGK
jgi:hypothetical protein